MRDLDQILNEWFDINDRIAQLEDAKKNLQAEMRDLGEGQHQGERGAVTVSPPAKRFNPNRAAEVLPIDLYNMCQETVITSARAKKVLPPALYEACSEPNGQPRVTVKAGA